MPGRLLILTAWPCRRPAAVLHDRRGYRNRSTERVRHGLSALDFNDESCPPRSLVSSFLSSLAQKTQENTRLLGKVHSILVSVGSTDHALFQVARNGRHAVCIWYDESGYMYGGVCVQAKEFLEKGSADGQESW